MSKSNVVVFTKNEIAALVSHNTEALHFAIRFLARNGNLRMGHDEKFVEAAKQLRKTNVLTVEQTHYFLRQTPYDQCVFITLYHRQFAAAITAQFEEYRDQLPSFSIPAQMRESRSARHARWGEANAEKSTALTLQMYRASFSEKAIEKPRAVATTFDLHVRKTRKSNVK
jgi:hypothetical protein